MYLFCTFVLEDGTEVTCRAYFKHTAGRERTDKVLELSPVVGLPADAEYDHDSFALEARRYYSEQLLKRST